MKHLDYTKHKVDKSDISSSNNITSIEEQRLRRLIDKNHSIREFGDRYEYCMIKEYERKYVDYTLDSIQFEDLFVQILTVKGQHKLVSIDFSKNEFDMEQVIYYLDLYGIKLLKDRKSEVKGAIAIIELKKFKGTPIILYEKGLNKIEVNHDEIIEITETFIKDKIKINTHNSKVRNSINPMSQIIFNDEQIYYIPKIEISSEDDVIISNGNIMNANYIGNYCGHVGFYEEKDDQLPISWIYDKHTTVNIDIYNKDGQKIVMIDHNYAIDIENLNNID